MNIIDGISLLTERDRSDDISASAETRYCTRLHRFDGAFALGPITSRVSNSPTTGCESCFLSRVESADLVNGRSALQPNDSALLSETKLHEGVRTLKRAWLEVQDSTSPQGSWIIPSVWWDDASDTVTVRGFLRVADCQHCSPGESPQKAYGEHTVNADTVRAEALWAKLLAAYVDPRVGVIPHLAQGRQHGLHVARSAILLGSVGSRDSEVVHSWGRGDSAEAAGSLAVLEGLERWSAAPPDLSILANKATWARESELSHDALNPIALGGHHSSVYARPGTQFRQYGQIDEPMWWVEGSRLSTGTSIHVPLSIAYFAAKATEWNVHEYVQGTSSGMAIGQTAEQATLNALFEIIERHALLEVWWRMTDRSVQWFRIDEVSFPEHEGVGIAACSLMKSGFTLRVLTTESPGSLTTAVAIAESEVGTGLPRYVVSSACDDEIDSAVRRAVEELAPTVRLITRLLPKVSEEQIRDAKDVRTAMHHWLLYASGAGEHLWRASGFAAPTKLKSWVSTKTISSPTSHAERLNRTIVALQNQGFEPVVVDLTRPELASQGLRVVKVMVPGTLPLSFGHGMERVGNHTATTYPLAPHPLA